MTARSSFGFQVSELWDRLLLCDRDNLGLLADWGLAPCSLICCLEGGGGIDRLARSTCVSVVPGSACLLLPFGTGKTEDNVRKGCEDEDDLVVFVPEPEVGIWGEAELEGVEDVEEPSLWTGPAVFWISCGC